MLVPTGATGTLNTARSLALNPQRSEGISLTSLEERLVGTHLGGGIVRAAAVGLSTEGMLLQLRTYPCDLTGIYL